LNSTQGRGAKIGPFNDYYQPTARFMEQLGVTVSVGAIDAPYSYDAHAPSLADLDSRNAKASLVNIVQAFSNVPKEYVEQTGLKQIVLESGSGQQGAGGYALTSGDHSTYYIDIGATANTPFGVHDDLHETEHLLDADECANAANTDPTYRSFNGYINIYGNGNNDSVTLNVDKYLEDYSKRLEAARTDSLKPGSHQAICALVAQNTQEAGRVMASTSYHPNPVEDKAELGAELASPDMYGQVTDPRLTVIRGKFKYLLARLYHKAPKVVEYFTTVASAPYPDQLDSQC
jgi:hypothetical protein